MILFSELYVKISKLYGCFYTSAALLAFVILLVILFVIVATLLIANHNERRTTEQLKKDFENLINKNKQ